MSDQIKFFRVDALWRRLLLLLPVGLAVVSVWFVARWCVGNMMAAYPQDVETALAAARLAPDDPQTHYSLAIFARKSFAPEELEEALRRYERATSRSPNDYRLWIELGRARGQTGDTQGGVQALRRAVELAPNYSIPRWYLGNMLLRAAQPDDAFAELRRASEIDPELRAQVFALAWNFFGGDTERLAASVGSSAASRAQLAEYFVKQKRLDEGLRLWSGLSATEKRAARASGESLMRALFEARRYHAGAGMWREIAPEGTGGVRVGSITNGGFEGDISAEAGRNPFDWEVKPLAQVQMGLDTREPHGGARSIRILFAARTNLTFDHLSQLVAVEPQTRYRLSFFVRTNELKSASTLITQVLGGAAGSVLAATPQLPPDTGGWQQSSVEFTTPPQVEAVSVRITRPPCTAEMGDMCPIFGKVWYDDFNLERIGGDSPGARAGDAAGARRDAKAEGSR